MTKPISASQLVYTKLNQPRITTQLVERKRLYASTRPAATADDRRGAGRVRQNNLVSSWATQSDLPCSWLSLNPNDNQLGVFFDYFQAAVERLYPDAIRQAAVDPYFGAVTAYSTAARKLADALDDIDERFTIILDDYHFIADADIHRFLAELLRFPAASAEPGHCLPHGTAAAVGGAAGAGADGRDYACGTCGLPLTRRLITCSVS